MGTDTLLGPTTDVTTSASPSLLTDGRVVGGTIAALLAFYVVADLGHTYDDPFILYRYAENLLDGHGWAYNPGEATENAATSTGYVLLLAALGALRVPLTAASTVLFVAGMGAAAWFTFLTHRSRGGTAAALLIVLSPTLIEVRGMETATVLGLVAATMWAAARHRELLAGILLVAVVIVRPDGVLLAPVLFLWWRVQHGHWPWRLTAVAAFGGGLYAMIVFATIGVPSTLETKIIQATIRLLPPFSRSLGDQVLDGPSWWAVIVAGMAMNRGWRRQPAVWLAGVYVVAYSALGVAYYPWYWAVPIYGLAVAAGSGLERVRLVPLVAVAAASLLAVSTTMPDDRAAYADAGRWLRENSPSDATVGVTEVGILGWYSKRPMREHLGLLDPETAAGLVEGDYSRWVADEQPDFLVRNAGMGPLDDAAFGPISDQYVVVWEADPITVLRSPAGSE